MEKQATLLSSNLKWLRERREQKQAAQQAQMEKAKILAYENHLLPNPSIEDLLKLSDYYKISIDMLLRDDLSQYSELKMRAMEDGFEYIKAKQLRILSITLDKEGNENIEYVPISVKAGYLSGYNDPEFVKDLPKAKLPFLSKGKTLRLFECEGDSMLPLPNKCKILGEYVDDWQNIKDGLLYIVISKQGYAIKKVYKKLENNSITLKSLNPLYTDYDVYLNEVQEIWKFELYLSSKLPGDSKFVYAQDLLDKMEKMRNSVLQGKLSA